MVNPLLMDQMSQKWFSCRRKNLKKTIYYSVLVKTRNNHIRVFLKVSDLNNIKDLENVYGEGPFYFTCFAKTFTQPF